MKKLIFVLIFIILANVYLWRNPVTEESYALHGLNSSYVIEFSFTNNCSYYGILGNNTKYDNCKYSYKENKITITYVNEGEKYTETYLLSKDHNTLTQIDNENIIYTRLSKTQIFNENH